MKNSILNPTKKQVIFNWWFFIFFFILTLTRTNFLISESFSNRQYLIFGVLTACHFAIVTTSIIHYLVNNKNTRQTNSI